MSTSSFMLHRLFAFLLFPVAFICFVSAFFLSITNSGTAYVVLIAGVGVLSFLACVYFLTTSH